MSAVEQEINEKDRPEAVPLQGAMGGGRLASTGGPANPKKDRSRKPATLSVNPDSIPEELKVLRQWLRWRWEWREGQKSWTKVPIHPSRNRNAASDDPRTWGTFETAYRNLGKDGVDGVGFVFTPDDGYCGVDIDSCRDALTGLLALEAAGVITDLNTYTEVSATGTGVHAIVKAALPNGAGRKKGKFEVYDRLRYFAFTGAVVGTPTVIQERQSEVDRLLENVFSAKKPTAKGAVPTASPSAARLSDDELLRQASANRNGAKFARLLAGQWTPEYPSQSEADLAFCMLLAFLTGKDATRVDRLFRLSGLYREKWDEKHYGNGETYGQRTVDKAISECQSTYTPAGSKAATSSAKTGTAALRVDILVEAGKLPAVVDQAEDALITDLSGERLYQRGGLLVRVIRLESDSGRLGLRRRAGSLVIRVVEIPYLIERLTRAAIWLKWDGRSEKWVHTDCPEKIALTLAARGAWKVPSLVGIIEAPTLRPDGSVLDAPGYDTTTGLMFDPGDIAFPRVPQQPTREEALQALALFLEMLAEFPFVEASDLSVALSAILTALVRRSLKTAPLHAFRAPKMGSGKSLLADIVALILTGRPCAVMTLGDDSNEERKRWLSVLIEGESIICIDNVERPLGGSALCSILTQDTYKDRVLGMSRTVSVSTAVTLMCTGNNLVFEGDLSTRVIPCDLDPGVERPEERSFKLNLHRYIPEHRAELVVAGLTILRAYFVAGRPAANVPPFGRFEDWSDTIRGALIWLGCADPCTGRQRIEEADPTRQRLGQLLLAWKAALPGRGATVAEAIRIATESGPNVAGDPVVAAQIESLHEALLAVGADRAGGINPRYVGKFLSHHEKRIEAGLRFRRGDDRNKVATWFVEGVTPGDTGVPGVSPSKRTETVTSFLDSSKEGYGEHPESPANPRTPVPCPSCKGTDYWTSTSGVVVCRRCHPPANKELGS